MAGRIVVDVDKTQQIGGQLTSRVQAIEGVPPGPQPSDPLGKTGALEQALSVLERDIATVKQDAARALHDLAKALTELAADQIEGDQQQAQQAQGNKADLMQQHEQADRTQAGEARTIRDTSSGA